MQKILWPANADEESLGRPVADGLPAGVLSHLEAAAALGIAEFSDVVLLKEYFKWMAWCYRCLVTLRAPPKSRDLVSLLDDAKLCKLAEEKLVKTIANLLGRIQYVIQCVFYIYICADCAIGAFMIRAWKVKALKWLKAPQSYTREKFHRSVEVNKAKQILQEGNTIPCECRLKDIIKNAISTVADPLAPDTGGGAAAGTSSTGKRSKRKDSSSATGASGSSGNGGSGLTCVVDEYLPYSSDEEAADGPAPKYTTFPAIYLAPSPNNIWPQQGESPLVLEPYPSAYRHVFLDTEGAGLPGNTISGHEKKRKRTSQNSGDVMPVTFPQSQALAPATVAATLRAVGLYPVTSTSNTESAYARKNPSEFTIAIMPQQSGPPTISTGNDVFQPSPAVPFVPYPYTARASAADTVVATHSSVSTSSMETAVGPRVAPPTASVGNDVFQPPPVPFVPYPSTARASAAETVVATSTTSMETAVDPRVSPPTTASAGNYVFQPSPTVPFVPYPSAARASAADTVVVTHSSVSTSSMETVVSPRVAPPTASVGNDVFQPPTVPFVSNPSTVRASAADPMEATQSSTSCDDIR